MSKTFHKSYRRILSIKKETYTSGSVTLPLKIVYWCIPNEITTRTIKSNHVAITVYINSKCSGVSARMNSNKLFSINIKNPLESKFFKTNSLGSQKAINEAFSDAWTDYLTSLGIVSGTVAWFNGDRGAITCNVTGQLIIVWACNIIGKKTWYSETACMYLKKGQTVTFKHSEVGAADVTGGIFDAEKWAKLDQSKLAFKCDENGKAINGLFA